MKCLLVLLFRTVLLPLTMVLSFLPMSSLAQGASFISERINSNETILRIQLKHRIGTDISREGDKVVCNIERPYALAEQQVLLTGKVYRVKQPTKMSNDSEIQIVLDALEWPNGDRKLVQVTIIDIGGSNINHKLQLKGDRIATNKRNKINLPGKIYDLVIWFFQKKDRHIRFDEETHFIVGYQEV